MSDAFITSLINGDVLGFVISCYVSPMGQGFYAFVLLVVFGALYNRTKSIALCAIMWLLLGSIWIVAVMEVTPIAMILCAAGITGIFFTLKYGGKR